ncbi:ChbG/HpnK family deacetylase [Castellaniella sp.]|uniref:ChbG/HpnK family deacetylase n=1 Tax=Castellaniella sp. TaxID=1955812 RepID=UPI003A938561
MNHASSSSRPSDSQYRRIVVCADDFGISASVDAAILDLAAAGRLSATSVLVDGPTATQNMPALLQTHLQIGLHLNLTESFGQAGVCLPLRQLILSAYLRRLSAGAVRDSIRRQLARFVQLTGRNPDYIDGHQHVHQLPVVRDALLAVLAEAPAHRPWLRHTGRPRTQGLPFRLQLKAWVIACLGSRQLWRQAQAAGFYQNPGFLGVYDFTGGTRAYAHWMSCWLAQAQADDVLMCHPSKGVDAQDPLSEQRLAEFSVLSGAPLGGWLANHCLIIAGTGPAKETP